MNACRPAVYSMLSLCVQGAAAAGAIALFNSIGNLGGFLGPISLGCLKDAAGCFHTGLLALAAMRALAGTIALFIPFAKCRWPNLG